MDMMIFVCSFSQMTRSKGLLFKLVVAKENKTLLKLTSIDFWAREAEKIEPQ